MKMTEGFSLEHLDVVRFYLFGEVSNICYSYWWS